jgi:hypothetical protein
MKTICSRLIAALLLPIAALSAVAPAIASGEPGIAPIYDFGSTPVGGFYCIPTGDATSGIPVIGAIDHAIEGNPQRVGVNIVRIDRNAAYRQVDGAYTVVVAGGEIRLRKRFSGPIDQTGGFSQSTDFRVGGNETFANAQMTGRRFDPDKGEISFRGTPATSVDGGEPVVTTTCLLERDIDQLDSQQLNQVLDTLGKVFWALMGRRLRIRV